MNTIPGISIMTHRFRTAEDGLPSVSSDPEHFSQGKRHHETVKLGEWLAASINTRNSLPQAVARDGNGITVLFDGYLTDVVGSALHREQPASSILALYREEGMAFVGRLRGSYLGSYLGLILDANAGRVQLFNDRRGGRPVFYRMDNEGSLALSPEVRLLAKLRPGLHSIDPAAVCEFMMMGSYYADHTLFPQIRKMPPGSILSISTRNTSIERYWRISFQVAEMAGSDESLIDECDAVLRQATRRLVRSCENPVLFLSGGIDSRLILGNLLRDNHKIPVACYGTSEGEDLQVAAALARRYGLSIREFPIDNRNPQLDFLDISQRSDGRAEMLDTPQLGRFTDQLSGEFDSYFQGDKCFDDLTATTPGEALTKLELNSLSQVSRLEDWLDPGLRKDVSHRIGGTLESLVADAGESDASGLLNHLYFEQRIGNKQNAFAAARLRSMEPARPWLDEDVADLFARLPGRMRAGKIILRRVYEKYHADMHEIPFSRKDSLPSADTYRKMIPGNPSLCKYVSEQLTDKLDDRLQGMLDQRKFRRFMESVATGQPFPSIQTQWWARLPGMWRFVSRERENRVHPITLMLRLLQLNIYLSNSLAAPRTMDSGLLDHSAGAKPLGAADPRIPENKP